LLATSTAAQFVSGPHDSGEILFLRDGSLMVQDFDLRRLELTGQPRRLAESVGNTRAFPFFAASASGNLVYRAAPAQTRQIAFFDRQGVRTGGSGQALPPSDEPVLNPSGTQFAISQWDATDRANDLFLYTLSPAGVLRLARGPSLNESPVWSADGTRVAYSSRRGNSYDLYQVQADGAGPQIPMLESPEAKFPSSWAPDGSLLYSKRGAATAWDVWLLPPGHAMPVSLLETAASETSGRFSPDGRWIAYLSDESGTTELYVRAFTSAPPGVGPRIPVSSGGANMPRWRADGRELFYMAPDGNLMAVALTVSPAFIPGPPAALFKAPAPIHWDVKPDGKSFVFAVAVGEPTLEPFTVVVNWQAEQRK
jgi:dipeptidyl aminopeptidase/acylaminoacyl peptidase